MYQSQVCKVFKLLGKPLLLRLRGPSFGAGGIERSRLYASPCSPASSSSVFSPHLEVSALVECVWRPEERHLPLEEVLLRGQLGPDALQRVLLEGLQLQAEGADGGGGGGRRARARSHAEEGGGSRTLSPDAVHQLSPARAHSRRQAITHSHLTPIL